MNVRKIRRTNKSLKFFIKYILYKLIIVILKKIIYFLNRIRYYNRYRYR